MYSPLRLTQLAISLSLSLLFHPTHAHPGYTTYDDGQWHGDTPTPTPAQQTGWYQPTSYTTWQSQQQGYVVTITSTIPCPISTTIVYDTTDCNECCWDNNCCQNQFGGTCWQGGGGGGAVGTTTQTLYTTTTPSNQADQQQSLVTTTSNGVVYVVVESGGSDNGQVQVVNNGAVSVPGDGGARGLLGLVVVGLLAVMVGGGVVLL